MQTSPTRQQVVSKLVLKRDSQRTDLLDVTMTNTWLIQALLELIAGPRPILMTAVRSDHSPGSLHNPPGMAADLWHADWASVGDDKITDVMKTISGITCIRSVGLAGIAKKYRTWVTWPSWQTVFNDNDVDHLHIGVATDGRL
jgi:hypothetical protein